MPVKSKLSHSTFDCWRAIKLLEGETIESYCNVDFFNEIKCSHVFIDKNKKTKKNAIFNEMGRNV